MRACRQPNRVELTKTSTQRRNVHDGPVDRLDTERPAACRRSAQPSSSRQRSMPRARARRRSTISCSTASFRTTSMTRCSPPCRLRPTIGRCRAAAKGHDLTDGTHTRVKIDLFPEYIRHLPPEKRAVWDVVGRALCSETVKRGVRAAAGARARAPLRRRLRQGRHVSDPDPDPRHSRLSHHAASRHALEGHHRPALSAARRRRPRISAPSSTNGCPTAACRSTRK